MEEEMEEEIKFEIKREGENLKSGFEGEGQKQSRWKRKKNELDKGGAEVKKERKDKMRLKGSGVNNQEVKEGENKN